MYSLMVERYCGAYDGDKFHNESVSVADASATTSDLDDDIDDVDAESLSLSLSAFPSSDAETCDVMAP